MTVQIKAEGNGQKSKDGVKSMKNKQHFILNGIHTLDFIYI